MSTCSRNSARVPARSAPSGKRWTMRPAPYMAARGMMRVVRERIELRGAGGEPVDFVRTVLSHGVAHLPPNVVAEDGSSLETVLAAGGEAWVVRVAPDGTEHARMEIAAGAPAD